MDAVRTQKAGSIDIARGMETSEAFQQIIGACLAHAAVNAELIDPATPEAVHQTRVGLRRARSAVSLFKPLLRRKPRRAVYRELQDAGRQLAPSRDWDVFVRETLPKIGKRFPDLAERGAGTGSALSHLEEGAETKRQEAYDSIDKQGVMQITRHRIELANSTPIDAMASDLLDQQYFHVRHACRHTDNAENRHALRKAVKKLRYSVEFLGSLYEGKGVKAFLDHCKEAQEVLGKMNDAITMGMLASELDPLSGRTVLIEWGHQIEERAFGQMAKAISDFRSAKPFWD
jgi:triphosphatase